MKANKYRERTKDIVLSVGINGEGYSQLAWQSVEFPLPQLELTSWPYYNGEAVGAVASLLVQALIAQVVHAQRMEIDREQLDEEEKENANTPSQEGK